MPLNQRSNLSARVKQQETITPTNKRYMIFFTTTVLILCGVIIVTSFVI